jgi:hypothetical protein
MPDRHVIDTHGPDAEGTTLERKANTWRQTPQQSREI